MKHRYIKNVSTLELDASKCRGCGLCVEVCPHRVFSIVGGNSHIIDKDRCMECGGCAINCPFGALSVDAGVGCAIAIINGNRKGEKPCC